MTIHAQETHVIRKFLSHRAPASRYRAWIPLLAILLLSELMPVTLTVAQDATARPTSQATQPPTASSDELPWNRPNQRSPRPPAEAEITAQEFLQQKGIDDSQLSFLDDNTDWSPEAEDTTIKILFHLPTMSPQLIHRWSTKPVPWKALASDPQQHQVDFFRIQGRVRRIEKKPIVAEAARLLHFDHYYQVHVQIPETPYTAIVCTRHFPTPWKPAEPLDEKVEIAGLFLKLGSQQSEGQKFYFAAPRIAWLPDRLNEVAGISRHHLLLASMGVDVGLFSHITRQTRHEFTGDERECFYQLLAAVSQTQASTLKTKQPLELDIPKLLRDTANAKGKLFTLEGTARRITRIIVDDPDIQDRFKADIDGDGQTDLLDHYYQIDMFVSLKGKSVQIKKDASDKNAPVFSNVYPVNVCVRTLPAELVKMNEELVAGKANQDLLRAKVRLQGFFFKTWSYQTVYASSKDEDGFQTSPIFIATEPEVISTEITRSPYIGALVATVFTIALIACWFFIWKSSRGDRQFKETALKPSREATALESLAQLNEASNPSVAEPPTPS